MVPHPQSRPRQVSQRPPTRPATAPTGGLTRTLTLTAKVEQTPSQAELLVPTAGFGCKVETGSLETALSASEFASTVNYGAAYKGPARTAHAAKNIEDMRRADVKRSCAPFVWSLLGNINR